MKKLGRNLLIATLLGVVVMVVIAFTSDVRKLRHDLVVFDWTAFLGALALASGNYVLRFLKWEFYLRRLRIGASAAGEPYRPLPTIESFVIYVAGFTMSITPGKAGEVFKSLLLASARGVPVARSAPIVVADRLTDLLSLIALVAAGSAFYPGYAWIALLAAAMVALVLFFVAFEPVTHALIAFIGRFGTLARLAPKLREAYAALREVTSPGALVAATAISGAAWALECSALWLIMRGLHEPVPLHAAFFVYATSTIAGAIAMLPGGIGGTEIVMREMLTRLGHVSDAAAGAGTLLVRFATLWFAVLVGFVALAIFRRRFDRHIAGGDPVAAATSARPPTATTR